MIQNLILHSIPLNELKDFIQEAIQSELTHIKQPTDKDNSERIYTRKEVANLLSISLPTLNVWTKEGTIKAYRIGSQVRYKHSDVEQALQEIGTLKYSRK